MFQIHIYQASNNLIQNTYDYSKLNQAFKNKNKIHNREQILVKQGKREKNLKASKINFILTKTKLNTELYTYGENSKTTRTELHYCIDDRHTFLKVDFGLEIDVAI